MRKVLVAMSGGVDSSVAAALLQKPPGGFLVTGAYMKNFSAESWNGVLDSDCPWEKDVADAKAVCDKLGIEFRSFNFEKEYREKVIDYFFNEYAAGRTPNPDVMCNKEIKFGLFLEKALELGFDYIATGHYARIKKAGNNAPQPPLNIRGGEGELYELLKGLDPKKDQSYFLYTLTQDQLKHVLFPIGEYTKRQVRQLAREFGLLNAEKKDSQGICFVGHINLREFLRQRIPERVGEIVDPSGRVIGQHRGAWYYTIGQRHGLGVGGGTPYYVARKDMASNRLMVTSNNAPQPPLSITRLPDGQGGGEGELYSKTAIVKNFHWINPLLISPYLRSKQGEKERGFHCQAKIRYQQPDQTCQIFSPSRREGGEEEGVRVVFDHPQFAPAPGQSIVFYDGEKVLGGGIIDNRIFASGSSPLRGEERACLCT